MDVIKATSHNKQFFSQQKVASQMPRGTRIDSTGTYLEVKGARNYTPCPLHIGTNEMFEDIVIRGLRADGLSSKLGVRNNRESIGKLIGDLFHSDSRREAILSHFNSKRQRSNAAKTVFATMTQEELKIICQELLPSKVDLQISRELCGAFAEQAHKLSSFVDVIKHLKQAFSNLDHQNELLFLHNFQTRGFFSSIITSITNLFLQIVEDAVAQTLDVEAVKCDEKLDKNAAEILLSVGSGGIENENTFAMSQQLSQRPIDDGISNKHDATFFTQISADEAKNWASVEIIDTESSAKSFVIKTPKQANGALDANKLIQLLNQQQSAGNATDEADISIYNLAVDGNNSLSTSQSLAFPVTTSCAPITTFEISLQPGCNDYNVLKQEEERVGCIPAKRSKT